MDYKFRGKRIDNGEWVYGFKIVDSFTAKVYIVSGEHIAVSPQRPSIACMCTPVHEVHPDSVGMWTGLKDMEDTEIYENDIIKLTYGIPPISDKLVIEYAMNKYVADISVSGWWMRNIRKNGCSSSLCSIYQGDITIIGNATDNPDLLNNNPPQT